MKSKAPPKRNQTVFDKASLHDIPYLLLNFGLMFGYMGVYIVFYYVELFALDRTNTSTAVSDYLLVILNLSSLPGRIVSGYYADKIGSVNVLTALAVSSTIMTFCLLVIRSTAGLIVFTVIYGILSGAFMGLPAAGVVALTDDKSKIGTRLGMTLGTVGFGVLVSSPIAGAILGSNNNWDGLICWCGALLVTGSICMVASRILKGGSTWAKL